MPQIGVRWLMRTAGLLVVLAVLPSPVPANAAELPAVMVLNIKHEEDASSGLAAILTELVLQGVHDLKQFRVVGQKDVNQMLSMEQQKQLAGCSDTSCLVEIAGALGTKYTVDGTIGIVGSSNVLSLTLLDTSKAVVVSRKTTIVKGEREQLLGSVSNLLRDLMEPVSKASGPSRPTTAGAAAATQARTASPYRLWGHVGVWGGLCSALLGGGFTALAKKGADDYNSGRDPAGAKGDIGTFNALAVTGYVLGGALAAAGVTLWILDPGDEAWAKGHSVSVAPAAAPGSVGLSLAGRW